MAEPTNKAKIHPAFAEALHADRESLNQRFALRQRARAKIDERLPLLEPAAEELVEAGNGVEQLGGLAVAARQDQDQAALPGDGLVKREDGGDRGLAGLAAAIEKHLPGAEFQDFNLPGVRGEAEQAHDLGRRGTFDLCGHENLGRNGHG